MKNSRKSREEREGGVLTDLGRRFGGGHKVFGREAIKKYLRGDSLIEVLMAVAVFGAVSIGAISIMNRGMYSAQEALEVTMARSEIDTQAEALRFLHDASSEQGAGNETIYGVIWDKIKELALTPSAAGGSFTSDYVNENIGSCGELYEEDSGKGAIVGNSFVINPKALAELENLGVNDDTSGVLVVKENGSKIGAGGSVATLEATPTFPRLLYSLSEESENLSDATKAGVKQETDLTAAQGIWVTPVRSASGVDCGGEFTPDYYDFYIRTCWDSPSGKNSSTISTTVRLYNPGVEKVASTETGEYHAVTKKTLLNFTTFDQTSNRSSMLSGNCRSSDPLGDCNEDLNFFDPYSSGLTAEQLQICMNKPVDGVWPDYCGSTKHVEETDGSSIKMTGYKKMLRSGWLDAGITKSFYGDKGDFSYTMNLDVSKLGVGSNGSFFIACFHSDISQVGGSSYPCDFYVVVDKNAGLITYATFEDSDSSVGYMRTSYFTACNSSIDCAYKMNDVLEFVGSSFSSVIEDVYVQPSLASTSLGSRLTSSGAEIHFQDPPSYDTYLTKYMTDGFDAYFPPGYVFSSGSSVQIKFIYDYLEEREGWTGNYYAMLGICANDKCIYGLKRRSRKEYFSPTIAFHLRQLDTVPAGAEMPEVNITEVESTGQVIVETPQEEEETHEQQGQTGEATTCRVVNNKED